MKAFNKTRQKLLADGRLKRYLLYAFGEIVLVVVGILIALQLNAWKADQKDRGLEQAHLRNLTEDLQLQLEIIQVQMQHDSMLTMKADSAYTFFNGGIGITQLEGILYGAMQLGNRKTFVESDATFQELLSTGGMNLITDPDLRKAFMRYHQQLDYTSKVINTNNGLIDALFNINSVNNSPSFSLGTNGQLDTSVQLSGQELYRLRKSIAMRKSLCTIALGICEKQRVATNTLLYKVDLAIKPN
ncbi:MAG: hypothetical protein KA186_07220 [Flavobacteriales bacterium]|nr:hypothetical protein [Flavobacteriales bacterium]